MFKKVVWENEESWEITMAADYSIQKLSYCWGWITFLEDRDSLIIASFQKNCEQIPLEVCRGVSETKWWRVLSRSEVFSEELKSEN